MYGLHHQGLGNQAQAGEVSAPVTPEYQKFHINFTNSMTKRITNRKTPHQYLPYKLFNMNKCDPLFC